MDLKDQLKQLFPDHEPQETPEAEATSGLWMQDAPIVCKYEKRKGKPITLLEGYTGAPTDLKTLAKTLKTKLSVGGSVKGDTIIIQGNYRDTIMDLLRDMGFKVKRVGG
ncbi:translation initiation factor [Maribacter sp. 2307ULW6-5]|uniref:translation initiation factor n=1 Tax=Maribacter sp. 2307ULW6-5 TaxID=3386275 RepID=UPI0039BD3EBC